MRHKKSVAVGRSGGAPKGEPSQITFYLDESGTFGENGAPLGLEASLVAGVMVEGPVDGLEAEAERLLAEAYGTVSRPLPATVHATEIATADPLLGALYGVAASVSARDGRQAVRIVNRQGAGFGDYVANHASMVAELVVRSLLTRGFRAGEHLRVRLVLATVASRAVLERADRRMLGRGDYAQRVREYLVREGVRLGLAEELGKWDLSGLITFESAGSHRVLQLADALANGSFRNSGRVPEANRRGFREAFGEYDFELCPPVAVEMTDRLLALGALGAATVVVMQALCSATRGADGERRGLVVRRERLLDLLTCCSDPDRETHLRQATADLEQTIEHAGRGLPEAGRTKAGWFLEFLDDLSSRLGESGPDLVRHHVFETWRWILSASNHLGDLVGARAAVLKLQDLEPAVAGSWEMTQSIIEARLATCIHRTDGQEPSAAVAVASEVISFLKASRDVHARWTGVGNHRAVTLGKALGTLLQAQIQTGLGDETLLSAARATSDEALRHFQLPHDIRRQHQVRAWVETLGGAWQEAKCHLAEGVGLPADDAFVDVLRHIGDLGAGAGFPLLHALRLVTAAARRGQQDEVLAPAAAIDIVTAWRHPLFTGEMAVTPYPWLGVRRLWMLLHVQAGRLEEAFPILETMRQARPTLKGVALNLILAAAEAEWTAHAWEAWPERARPCLNALCETLDRTGKRAGDSNLQASILTVLESLKALKGRPAADTSVKSTLLSFAGTVV